MAHVDLANLLASAAHDRFGTHRLSEDPEDADMIVFIETISTFTYRNHYFQQVRKHPLYRQFRWKSYLFCAADKVIPFLPGVYASIERRWYSSAWTRAGHYPGVREEPGHPYEASREPSLLFTFVGSCRTHCVRSRLMKLKHPAALLLDTDDESQVGGHRRQPPQTTAESRERYLRSIEDSAFVLCPRGGGTSTFRLFESMMLGRVPVIISDQWVPPDGPDWERFSLRVKECDLDTIPGLLEAHASEASSMGRLARATWVDWFSESASFHRTVDWCLDLARFTQARGGFHRYAPRLQMLRPYHAARAAKKGLGHGFRAPREPRNA
jgi:Exostosin family